jgi:glutathione S-transferase
VAELTLHHLEQSRSQRALWLLEELGVDYEMKRYPRTREGRAPTELKGIHPLGKSPVITHDGNVVAESGALVEYVLDAFGDGRMRPEAGSKELQRYRFFLHFAEGSMMAPLLVKLITGRLKKGLPLLGKAIAGKIDASYTDGEITRHLDFVEESLEGREWLTGKLSGADVMMSYPVQASLARGDVRGGRDYPNVRAYVDRIAARPAWKRAIEKGGEPFLRG